MIEGICITADGWCREYTIDQVAYCFPPGGQRPPLEEHSETLAELGEIRGGMYAASVIGFIREEFGADAVRSLGTEGSTILSDTMGLSFDRIEVMWKEYLGREVDGGIQVDIVSIDVSGCG